MRVFDWFIAGAVAMLYVHVANVEQQSIEQKFDPVTDRNYVVAYTVDGTLVINWPFIFASIALACLLMMFVTRYSRNRDKEPRERD